MKRVYWTEIWEAWAYPFVARVFPDDCDDWGFTISRVTQRSTPTGVAQDEEEVVSNEDLVIYPSSAAAAKRVVSRRLRELATKEVSS